MKYEYEENKEKCEELGYFDKLKAIPKQYKNIAVITRYESAAYNDLINVLKECLSMNYIFMILVCREIKY